MSAERRRAGARGADDARALLAAIALRAETARRLESDAGEAVLRSIVEATVTLFQANAASIALYDAAADQLVFRVAAGAQGEGVLGLSIPTDQGLAGYVFSTGQAIAISDVATDTRFGRAFAERTGYVPTSIVAVPLVDDEGTIGVLQVLDKRDSDAFSLRDVELASVFARQAAIAISASRVERDTSTLLVTVAQRLTGGSAGADALADAAGEALALGDRTHLWALVEAVARLRHADPAQMALVADLLGVLATHAERAARSRRRTRPGRSGTGRRAAAGADEE